MNRPKLEAALFFLTILFLPTQLGRHFWPSFSSVYSLRIDYLSPTIYFWDLLVAALVIVWLIGRGRVNRLAALLLLVFLFVQTLSILGAENVGAGLVRWQQYLFVSSFAIYLASQNFLKIKNQLARALSLAVIFEAFLAIGQFLWGRSLGLWILGEREISLSTPSIANFNWYGQIFLRPYGTFPHPNVLAAFMVLTMPIVVFLSKSKRIVVGLGVVSTVLSFSRSATLLLFGIGLIFLRKKLKILVVILTIILPLVYVRFNSAFNFDSLSLSRREELSRIAFDQIKKEPLLGIGLNNFIPQVASSNLVPGPSRFLQPVHNIFLLSLAETGLVGFLGFLILMGYPIIKLWGRKNQPFSQLLLLSWGSVLFLGMFDHYFLTLPQGQRLLFLVWGLSMLEFKMGESYEKDSK